MDTTIFDPEVEEDEFLDFMYNNGEESLVSVSIERGEMHNSLGRARAVFRNREDTEPAMLSNINPINPEYYQDAMALSLRSPIYMSLYSFPEWEGSTSQVNSFQEWTIPMTQVSTSLLNPIGSAMYRNPHAQGPMMHHVPLLNPLGSSMYRNPHAQEPMMHHVPLLNPLRSSMYRNTHAQEPMMHHVPLLNPLGSSMYRNPHAQEPMMHHVPLFNPLGSSIYRNPHAQEPMMHHVPNLNHIGSAMYRNPHSQEPMMHHVPNLNHIGSAMYRNPHSQEPMMHHVPHLQWRNQIRDGMARKLILYVANFSYELEEADLKNMFLRFGEVTSCRIRRHKDTGRSRGDGFVHFSTTEDAQRATVLNGQIFNERQIWVSFAKAKSEV